MKMRLDIDFKAKTVKMDDGSYATHFVHLDSSVLLRYVSYVVINDKMYYRPKKDSREIQNYYYFVIKNKMKLTEIMMADGKHYFLKEGNFHSYSTYCYYDPKFKTPHYAINGVILTEEEGRRFELRKKISKLINQTK